MGSTLEQLTASIETRIDFLDKSFAGRTDPGAWREAGQAYRDMMADLIASEGAKYRTTNGTYELTLASIRTSCTAGDHGLIKAWLRKAKAKCEARRVSP